MVVAQKVDWSDDILEGLLFFKTVSLENFYQKYFFARHKGTNKGNRLIIIKKLIECFC